MPQSLAKVLVHLIFSTKNREPTIAKEIQASLHAYLTGILDNLRCPSLQTGGTVDHVHSLISLARTQTVADVVEEVKKSPSRWMKEQGVAGFFWQAGYGAFSIGESQVSTLVRLHRPAGRTSSARELPGRVPTLPSAVRRCV